jgi:hypothetical protein
VIGFICIRSKLWNMCLEGLTFFVAECEVLAYFVKSWRAVM